MEDPDFLLVELRIDGPRDPVKRKAKRKDVSVLEEETECEARFQLLLLFFLINLF